MATPKRIQLKTPSKLNMWLKLYTDKDSKSTFFNKTESARQAGYQASTPAAMRQIGCQNFNKFKKKIGKWLDENDLSENALKVKLIGLLDAKETKFFSAPVKDTKGQVTDILIKKIEVEATETQRRTLNMALMMKGMNAPSKLELSGENGGPLTVSIVKFSDTDVKDESESK